jgi:uncharacterized membrane protein YdbT with pleckstrin-like domain
MSYIERSLTPGERVLYSTGLHWVVLVNWVLCGGFLLFLSGWALLDGAWLAALALGLLGFMIIGLGVLIRNATEMAITDKRVIVKVGLLRRTTVELFLSKIEGVTIEQGFWERLLGYGSVVVIGVGGTPQPFKNVRSPLEFRRQVQFVSCRPVENTLWPA